MLLNASKCQGYSFYYHFELLRENQEQKGGGGVKLPPPTQIKVNSLGFIMKKSCKFWIK